MLKELIAKNTKKQQLHGELSEEQIAEIVQAAKPYTMITEVSLRFNILSVLRAINEGHQGAVVECGTWKGGSSLVMLLAQLKAYGKVIKPVYLLDSFEGLPEAKAIDGTLARLWQSKKDVPEYFDNCSAAVEDVERMLKKFGFKKKRDYNLVKGWFDDTVPQLAEQLQTTGIALLRLDGDWYESTKVCLDNLVPIVSPKATIIMDDYYAWDGCAVAVHEYLGVHKLPYRIRSMDQNFGAYFYKMGREEASQL